MNIIDNTAILELTVKIFWISMYTFLSEIHKSLWIFCLSCFTFHVLLAPVKQKVDLRSF